MKKVVLTEAYRGMEPGTVYKTDGGTARMLIERGLAYDPEGEIEAKKKERPATETASLDPGEKAVMPQAKPRRGGYRRGRGG